MWASDTASPPRLHTSFTTRPHRDNRMWSLPRQPAARQRDQGVQHVNPRFLPAALAACVLATGLAACGSDDDNGSSASGTTNAAASDTSSSVKATLNGGGSTFAAPIYQQIGSDLKDKGLTINYQGVGSGAGVSQFAAGTLDFAGSHPALGGDDKAAIKKGEAVQNPVPPRAITPASQPHRGG